MEPGTPDHTRCQKRGCKNGTAGGKPYCALHLEELPYVARLRRLLSERDPDAEPSTTPLALDSPAVTDVLRLLQDGPKTVAVLSNRLAMPPPVVLRAIQTLDQAGLVERQPRDWRTEVVRLRGGHGLDDRTDRHE